MHAVQSPPSSKPLTLRTLRVMADFGGHESNLTLKLKSNVAAEGSAHLPEVLTFEKLMALSNSGTEASDGEAAEEGKSDAKGNGGFPQVSQKSIQSTSK